MSAKKYHPEEYWSNVANLITQREDSNVIAGDDEPYYRYKREEFLKLLHTTDFSHKSVLEIGCGPGGNLIEVSHKQPSRLVGVDISNEMVALATKNVSSSIEIFKSNGTELPFPDKSFDIVFTATVLQHNTDETMLKSLMKEICRVSKEKVVIFEKIDDTVKGDDLCMARPIEYYSEIMKQYGFTLKNSSFINIRVSYYLCGFVRKFLNRKDRKEGEPLNMVSNYLQKIILIFSRPLDKIFKSNKDLAKLEYLLK
ncbi:MAG: class I SAM-dependent methyltransferase [Saprospiraceae bacterium]|nr:class I SAM-dependent methyltransferase [Saprospiraceae bacterium]